MTGMHSRGRKHPEALAAPWNYLTSTFAYNNRKYELMTTSLLLLLLLHHHFLKPREQSPNLRKNLSFAQARSKTYLNSVKDDRSLYLPTDQCTDSISDSPV